MEACAHDAPRQSPDRRLQKLDQRQRVVAAAVSRRDGVGYRVPARSWEGWGAVTCGMCVDPLFIDGPVILSSREISRDLSSKTKRVSQVDLRARAHK